MLWPTELQECGSLSLDSVIKTVPLLADIAEFADECAGTFGKDVSEAAALLWGWRAALGTDTKTVINRCCRGCWTLMSTSFKFVHAMPTVFMYVQIRSFQHMYFKCEAFTALAFSAWLFLPWRQKQSSLLFGLFASVWPLSVLYQHKQGNLCLCRSGPAGTGTTCQSDETTLRPACDQLLLRHGGILRHAGDSSTWGSSTILRASS